MLEGHKDQPQKKVCKVFKDVRIFVNSINHAIKVMKDSGASEAKTNMVQNDEFIEYVIKIPL